MIDTTDTWILTRRLKHGRQGETFFLERPSSVGAFRMEVRYDTQQRDGQPHTDEAPIVAVKIEAPSITYAHAEAARLYAMVCDTIGDAAMDGERWDLAKPPTLDLVSRCPRVALEGHDALIIIAPFFGVEGGICAVL